MAVAVGVLVKVAVAASVDTVVGVAVAVAVDTAVGVSAGDVAAGGAASATEGLTWMEMAAGSLEAPAALYARTMTVWLPEVAFQV